MSVMLQKGLIINGGGSGGAVDSVNGKTGNVILNAKDVNAIPQYDTMPEPTSANVGEIAQYAGETIPDVPATAIATQTVGSSLTDLSVNVDTFIEAEQPSGSETVDFVRSIPMADVDPYLYNDGTFTIEVVDFDKFIAKAYEDYKQEFGESSVPTTADIHISMTGENLSSYQLNFFGDEGMTANVYREDSTPLSSIGVYFDADGAADISKWTLVGAVLRQSSHWTKNGLKVSLDNFGITYNGTPASGDTISVAYTPFVAGITNGYFYKSSVEYSDPVATISQTTGSGLSNLSVDVDRFVEAEQPTQDETVDFNVASSLIQFNTTSVTDDGVTLSIDANVFAQTLNTLFPDVDITQASPLNIGFVQINQGEPVSEIAIDMHVNGTQYYWGYYNSADWESAGIYVSGEVISDFNAWHWETFSPVTTRVIWYKNGSVIDLADYGISYSGTVVTGDTLTVAYTAPAPIGYAWNQINVQPSSGSGGGEGIEWKAALDLPENYSGSEWDTSAIVAIPGGLPDGDYEFYYRTLCYSESEYAPKRYATTKIQFHFDSANSYCYGSFAPVIDGNWMPSGNYRVNNSNLWSVFGSHDNNFIFFSSSRPFTTDVPAYNDVSGGLKDCFKVSSFKNIQTGQEYVPVLTLYDGTIDRPMDYSYNGYISMQAFQDDPYIPVYHANSQLSYSDDSQYARLQPYQGISRRNQPAACSELDVALVSSNGGKWHCIVENGYNSYTARVLEASGDLANAQIGFNGSGQTFLFFNTASGTSGHIYAAIGAKGSSEPASGWVETPDTFTPVTITRVGMPVTADNFGMIEQHLGATDSTYTNGYFYKATGDEVVVPATTVCNQTYGEEIDITCLNFDGLVAALSGWTGWTEDFVKELLTSSGNFMAYRPNEDSKWYFSSNFGPIPDYVGVGNYFTLSPEPSAEIQFTIEHTEGHTEIQNGRWEQVDVQPLDLTGVTGYDATKTQVLKNVQGGVEWAEGSDLGTSVIIKDL